MRSSNVSAAHMAVLGISRKAYFHPLFVGSLRRLANSQTKSAANKKSLRSRRRQGASPLTRL